jgi:hypothetical protein
MLRGPVPQFMPMTSTGKGSSAVSAAPISVPGSIVPNVSIVTCAMTGTRPPRRLNSAKMAASVAFV